MGTHPINESKKVNGPSFVNKLASDQSELRKEVFSLWIKNTSSSKAILFLVFQTVQKMQRGPTFQTVLRFFPTKKPFQPNRVSLINNRNTHDTPKRVKASPTMLLSFHNEEGGGQWIPLSPDKNNNYLLRPIPSISFFFLFFFTLKSTKNVKYNGNYFKI